MGNQIELIQERNRKVELDKAWETSLTRRSVVSFFTYLIAVLFMSRIGIAEPFLNALVPTGGYILSTLTLPVLKKKWIKKYGN